MARDRWLVVCDIDGTLLLPAEGNPGLDELNGILAARSGEIVFAVDSGRSLAEVAMVAENGPIRRPDWVIADVGNSLYSGFSEDLRDAEWESIMEREWDRAGIMAALAGIDGLAEQEPCRQYPGKISFYVTGVAESVVPVVQSRLAPWSPACKVIVTVSRYVDVVPPWGGKGSPVVFLADRLGIEHDRIIVAGDSGNDRDLFTRGLRSVIVANHTDGLDDLAGFPSVYFSRARAASGVIEGLRHFGAL